MSNQNSIIIDANLLVLLIIGLTDISYIAMHKRLGGYTKYDFLMLLEIIRDYQQIILTPNTLTEASNLVRHTTEPARSAIMQVFSCFIADHNEVYCESKGASKSELFIKLGLTDAMISDLALDQRNCLLTVDLKLYLMTLSRGGNAENFNHYRDTP